MKITPIAVFCRNCQSHAGQKCTQPTDDSRKAVNWFHSVRENDAAEAEEIRQEDES